MAEIRCFGSFRTLKFDENPDRANPPRSQNPENPSVLAKIGDDSPVPASVLTYTQEKVTKIGVRLIHYTGSRET